MLMTILQSCIPKFLLDAGVSVQVPVIRMLVGSDEMHVEGNKLPRQQKFTTFYCNITTVHFNFTSITLYYFSSTIFKACLG